MGEGKREGETEGVSRREREGETEGVSRGGGRVGEGQTEGVSRGKGEWKRERHRE